MTTTERVVRTTGALRWGTWGRLAAVLAIAGLAAGCVASALPPSNPLGGPAPAHEGTPESGGGGGAGGSM